ncbi:MAG: S41 family peptidase, partial [Candidatus Kapaibacterium sp.]
MSPRNHPSDSGANGRRRGPRTRVLILLLLALVAGGSIGRIRASESLYYRISKALETYAEVFRRVSMEYVDDVEPERFVRIGMDAMLASLDPYTVYMDETQSEDFDSQVSGRYVGLGIQVGVYDSMLTVTGVTQGYAAEKAGLRKGDRLLSVDGVNVLTVSPKDLRRYTRGERGTVARVAVLREGRSDTLRFDVQRSDIVVRSVTYAVRRADGIAVIKLERFTRKTAQEMLIAMDSLRAQGSLSGIILDLRDNPGGLLDAAVSVCELFTKTGSVIVTTKGRRDSDTRVFTNNSVPYDIESPMIVLVNKASASAAEVVAGCLQDLDRAVVCGEQTFGKGLVQSQYPLPYGTTLKLTTQRYYCPSGRCIQRRDYSKRSAGLDSVYTPKLFATASNRPVTDACGITPDTAISEEELPAAVQEVVKRGLIFKAATAYAARTARLPAG